MKKISRKLIALCLAVCLLLTGCSQASLKHMLTEAVDLYYSTAVTSFEDMQYTQPDVDRFRLLAEECMDAAATATDVEALMELVYEAFDCYYDFQTNYSLADIYYCKDLTDIYWQEAYSYCLEKSSEVSAVMDRLLYALADCPLREQLEAEEYFGPGYFDDYTGDSLWDETFTQLMAQESELINQYYELNSLSADTSYGSNTFYNTYGLEMAQLYVELVALRQEIADYAGYDSYPEFAYDFYYTRDYTPQQAEILTESIRQSLVPFYQENIYSLYAGGTASVSEREVFSFVESCANAMGGNILGAFSLMDSCSLYDISAGENKYTASFEVFLTSYGVPYIFVSPSGYSRDMLTFAHEFGHFCSDYMAGGSIVSIDVAEIFSQAMEFMCLCYSDADADLIKYKLADGISTFVEQSAYATFEQRVYALEGDDLTVEVVFALFGQVCTEYGLDMWGVDSREFVLIPHFFTNPMYVISYVVSNDAALQIYQAELDGQGQGLSLLEENLATEEVSFLAFLDSAGLENPFRADRGGQILNTFQQVLDPLE